MKRLDLTGQTFGNLTVIELSDKLDSARARLWKCQCACGNIIDFDEEVLESGSIVCDKCGETLEFSFEDDEDEDDGVKF